jgi:hypothetical protein
MCVQHTGLGVHWHVQLAIAILGSPYTIPASIGVGTSCMRPIHTHDTTGTIHIELPGPRPVYIRDFFAIWGESFSQTRILSYVSDATYEIVMSVGGTPSTAYEGLALQDGLSIVIEYRTR